MSIGGVASGSAMESVMKALSTNLNDAAFGKIGDLSSYRLEDPAPRTQRGAFRPIVLKFNKLRDAVLLSAQVRANKEIQRKVRQLSGDVGNLFGALTRPAGQSQKSHEVMACVAAVVKHATVLSELSGKPLWSVLDPLVQRHVKSMDRGQMQALAKGMLQSKTLADSDESLPGPAQRQAAGNLLTLLKEKLGTDLNRSIAHETFAESLKSIRVSTPDAKHISAGLMIDDVLANLSRGLELALGSTSNAEFLKMALKEMSSRERRGLEKALIGGGNLSQTVEFKQALEEHLGAGANAQQASEHLKRVLIDLESALQSLEREYS